MTMNIGIMTGLIVAAAVGGIAPRYGFLMLFIILVFVANSLGYFS